MSKVCDKHMESPAFIYGECIGCELETMRAEAQALREQNTKFQHMLADVVAKHFAENIKRSTAQNSMDVYLSEGIRLLEEELAALRARVVVPDGYALVPVELTRDMWVAVNKEDDKAYAGACDHGAQFDWLWEAAIEAAPRLNGNAVSEGLLRRTLEFIKATNYQGSIPLGLIAELSELLGEGKEHE